MSFDDRPDDRKSCIILPGGDAEARDFVSTGAFLPVFVGAHAVSRLSGRGSQRAEIG